MQILKLPLIAKNFGVGRMAAERYHPLVADDLRQACRHYDKIAIAVGNRFRASVEQKINDVADRPESFGQIYDDYRCAVLRRFPHVVIFVTENGITTIYGIRHVASDRSTWFVRKMPDSDG